MIKLAIGVFGVLVGLAVADRVGRKIAEVDELRAADELRQRREELHQDQVDDQYARDPAAPSWQDSPGLRLMLYPNADMGVQWPK